MNGNKAFSLFTSRAKALSGEAATSSALVETAPRTRSHLSFLLLVIALFFSSCSGSGPSDSSSVIDVGSNSADIVLASGDSTTYDHESRDHSGYRFYLQDYLAQQGRTVTVVNGGRPGSRTGDFNSFISDFARYSPGVIVLQIGLNDALNVSESGIAGIANNMRHIVGSALANDSVVVLTTLNPVCGSRHGQNEMIQLINESYRQVALEHSTNEAFVLADVAAAFATNDPATEGCALISSVNYNHPTRVGYDLMAQVIALALEPLSWESGGAAAYVSR